EIIKNSDMFIRVPPAAVDKIIAGGRFKSSFETKSKDRDYQRRRTEQEDLVFGLKKDSDKTKRPIYGYLGEKEFDESTISQMGPSQYGNVAIRMKPESKERASITDRDTWGASPVSEAKNFNGASLVGTSIALGEYVFNKEEIQERVKSASKSKSTSDLLKGTQSPYMEMHLHGGAKASEIAEIIYTKGDKPTKKTLSWAKKNGVTITIK
ncbi:MAG: hypothetical protein ACRC78_02150, partial [Planktothrix sp.]